VHAELKARDECCHVGQVASGGTHNGIRHFTIFLVEIFNFYPSIQTFLILLNDFCNSLRCLYLGLARPFTMTVTSSDFKRDLAMLIRTIIAGVQRANAFLFEAVVKAE
jgi:hypothetical protein